MALRSKTKHSRARAFDEAFVMTWNNQETLACEQFVCHLTAIKAYVRLIEEVSDAPLFDFDDREEREDREDL